MDETDDSEIPNDPRDPRWRARQERWYAAQGRSMAEDVRMWAWTKESESRPAEWLRRLIEFIDLVDAGGYGPTSFVDAYDIYAGLQLECFRAQQRVQELEQLNAVIRASQEDWQEQARAALAQLHERR